MDSQSLKIRQSPKQTCAQCELSGVQLNQHGPTISHIFFADDTLIFLKADQVNCRNLVKLMKVYCDALGQLVNLNKSSVFFGTNVPVVLAEELGGILGMPLVDDPGTYLGVPEMWGRSKSKGLAYVNDRILSKIQG
ncbi:uncharacterized protein [Malus domestica]|uniref:uncharacterized protein n=1 Tax=Malus domestica TaxID=3750 RepID=UPI0039754ECF